MANLIYILEDNRNFRKALQRILEGTGYRVKSFDYGFDIISVLKNQKAEQPDLIIADLMMPELDGLSFIQILNMIPHTQHIKKIMLSAKKCQRTIDKAFKNGFEKYLIKNGDFDVLLEEIHQTLNQKKTKISNSGNYITLLEPTENNSDFEFEIEDNVIKIFSRREYPVGSVVRIKRGEKEPVVCYVEDCEIKGSYNVAHCRRVDESLAS